MTPVSVSAKPTTVPRRITIPGSRNRGNGSISAQPFLVSEKTDWRVQAKKELLFLVKGWGLSFASWGMVAFLLGAKLVIDTGVPWTLTFRASIRDWLPWAVMTPIVFRFVMRFPIDRPNWKLSIPLHIFCCVVVVSLCQKWQAFYDPSFRPAPLPPLRAMHHAAHRIVPGTESSPSPNEPVRRGPSRGWVDLFHLVTFGLPLYLMIVSGAHAVIYFRREQQRAASLVSARLEVLRGQLQPHFLFNTLNVIAELVHEDPEKADGMITALSDMLRLTLDSASDQLVPLERETDLVSRYFAIMQTRLGDRLRYYCDITPPARAALVPPFLCQPLVENAILHGIEPVPNGGTVTVRAWINSDKLHVSVADDGVGMRTLPIREGIGLANTRARLHELFGNAAQVSLSNGNGVTVEITMPLRT
jgi:hypothetical protein